MPFIIICIDSYTAVFIRDACQVSVSVIGSGYSGSVFLHSPGFLPPASVGIIFRCSVRINCPGRISVFPFISIGGCIAVPVCLGNQPVALIIFIDFRACVIRIGNNAESVIIHHCFRTAALFPVSVGAAVRIICQGHLSPVRHPLLRHMPRVIIGIPKDHISVQIRYLTQTVVFIVTVGKGIPVRILHFGQAASVIQGKCTACAVRNSTDMIPAVRKTKTSRCIADCGKTPVLIGESNQVPSCFRNPDRISIAVKIYFLSIVMVHPVAFAPNFQMPCIPFICRISIIVFQVIVNMPAARQVNIHVPLKRFRTVGIIMAPSFPKSGIIYFPHAG